jgi:outer membrane protein assembly factor BamB
MHTFSAGISTPIVVDSLIYIAFWNNFSERDNLGNFFDYEDFSKVIKDFDKDADHLLSRDEIPEDLKLASRIGVAEYEGATVFVRDLFWFIDKDKNKEIDSVEWKEYFDYTNKFVIKMGISAINAINEGETEPEEIIWMQSENIPEVPSPIFVNGFIYIVKNGWRVTCMDASSGKPYYSERLGTTGGYFSSPVSANGHIYIAGHRGIVHVIKASNKPEIVSETRLQGKIMATPAIAGNNLYIRTSDYLYAFGK